MPCNWVVVLNKKKATFSSFSHHCMMITDVNRIHMTNCVSTLRNGEIVELEKNSGWFLTLLSNLLYLLYFQILNSQFLILTHFTFTQVLVATSYSTPRCLTIEKKIIGTDFLLGADPGASATVEVWLDMSGEYDWPTHRSYHFDSPGLSRLPLISNRWHNIKYFMNMYLLHYIVSYILFFLSLYFATNALKIVTVSNC